jgi:predicted phosphodiesterase
MSKSQMQGNWLHISDLHLKSQSSYDEDAVLKALVKKVRSDAVSSTPNAVFVTGDISFSGKKEEFQKAERFFDDLLIAAKLTKNELFLIPGNHDVFRPGGMGLLRTLQNEEQSVEYFHPSTDCVHITHKLSNFMSWHNSYFQGIRQLTANTTCGPVWKAKIGEVVACVVPINTALFCVDDGDHGKLWVGRSCLSAIVDELEKEDAGLRIALMHHPLEWLNEFERSNIQSLIFDNFDVILRGHLHSTESLALISAHQEAIIIAAGAAYQTRKYQNKAVYASIGQSQIEIHPIRYEDSPHAVWTTDTSVFPNSSDFTHTYPLPMRRQLDSEVAHTRAPEVKGAQELEDSAKGPANIDQYSHARSVFEADLFRSAGGSVIYAEPRLSSTPQSASITDEMIPVDCSFVAIRDICLDDNHYWIEGPPECGQTTLARRIAVELTAAKSSTVILRDARLLPNYRKKLMTEFENAPLKERNILILDNCDHERDARLISEVFSLQRFQKIIVLAVSRERIAPVSGDSDLIDSRFLPLYHWYAGRACIRAMAQAALDTAEENLVSNVVDKIYRDLLTLCIPLTPHNIIMYLKVIHKEGDFAPVSRVDIVGHYINEVLRGPADAYSGSFNARNKIDVLGAFVFYIYNSRISEFRVSAWAEFCTNYKKETLIDFDELRLLNEYIDKRIFVNINGVMRVKYSFFYAYLLGHHIVSRKITYDDFVQQRQYRWVDGLVEVLTGISRDNEAIVNSICDALEDNYAKFYATYMGIDFDPLRAARWPSSGDDDAKFWKPIQQELEAGPKSSAERDLLKTSLRDEILTHDQKVKFQELLDLEYDLFHSRRLLVDALLNSDTIPGSLKKRAVKLIFQCQKIILQIGAVLAPEISECRNVQWGGLLFVNPWAREGNDGEELARMCMFVITGTNYSVAKMISESLGSRKLGEVFKSLINDVDIDGAVRFQLFCCLIFSKPQGWVEAAQSLIELTERDSYYLKTYLKRLVDVYREEINTSADKESIKWLIAYIHAKREAKKEAPGRKLVRKIMRFVDEDKLMGN